MARGRRLALCSLAGAAAAAGPGPEQIHLALTSDPSAVAVTWVSLELELKEAKVWYAQEGTAGRWIDAAVHQYAAGGAARSVATAVMTGLVADTTARYRVAHGGLESAELAFRAPPVDPRPVRVIAFGDMGTGDFGDHSGPGGALYNDGYVAGLLGTPSEPDLVVHVGDVAYDRGNETVWDVFFRKAALPAR
ncbi:unnamed protein product [Prorocentrum cordatum]|uniref:Purple acid phosphatase N-terminal domain-containing protein n=1 Tax=Prorocentrum cordatum TaxID=2364126 RepID=A0ABN9WTN3_9DINO|nr:unnamed protein product [Polarella glacialis]